MRQITLIVTFAFVSLFTFLIASLATTDTLKDDFKDPRLTKELWEIKKGDWKIKDGWWESNSPAIGQGSFVLFSDIETHDDLVMRVKCRDEGGGAILSLPMLPMMKCTMLVRGLVVAIGQ
jgi:hypothetical protein